MGWITKAFALFLETVVWQAALVRLEKRALLIYMRTVQVARASVAGLVVILLLMQLLAIGMVGTVVTFVLWQFEDPAARYPILLGVFLVFSLVPLLGLRYMLSEGLWYRLSHARKMMDHLTSRS